MEVSASNMQGKRNGLVTKIKTRCLLPFLFTSMEGLDVVGLLTDPAKIAKWNNENLPNDRMSIENVTVLTNAE